MIYVIQNLTGYGPWGHKESDMTERLTHTHTHTHTHTCDMPCQVMANTMKKIIKQCREMKKIMLIEGACSLKQDN